MLKKILILLSVGVLVIFMSAFVLAQQDTTPPPPPSSGASQVQSNVAANSQAGTEKSTDAAATQPQQEPVSVWAILGSVAFLILVLGAVLAYMFYLQRRFLKACEEENQLPIFLNAPAGLPPGTVRNVLIFLTVVFLLFLVTLQAFRVAPNFIESFLSFLESTNGWVIFSILILSLVVGGFFWYMFTLQKKIPESLRRGGSIKFVFQCTGRPSRGLRAFYSNVDDHHFCIIPVCHTGISRRW
jgi:hypothetical protein